MNCVELLGFHVSSAVEAGDDGTRNPFISRERGINNPYFT